MRFVGLVPASTAIVLAFGVVPSLAADTAMGALPHGKVLQRGVRILPAETPAPTSSPTALAPTSVTLVSALPSADPSGATLQPAVVTVPQGTAPLPASVIKACARPIAQPDLQVDATSDFGTRLRPRLIGGKRVAIDLSTPYAASKTTPAGLAPWLEAVRNSGGQVTVSQYCLASRGFGSWFKNLFAAKPASALPSRAYRSARNYDVVLHTDALDQTVTQVEFVPRASRSSS